MKIPKRILIVDDNVSLVNLVEGILKKEGYEVSKAYDGIEGLRKAKNEKPNLIILDIVMPKMNGYELCAELQRNKATENIPVLFLTVKGGVGFRPSPVPSREYYDKGLQDRLRGFDLGAIEFLTKPVKARELIERVNGLVWMDSVTGEEE
jgi:two-component system, OmpR family, alkaline phosphatase synthesis response regulator PhoP